MGKLGWQRSNFCPLVPVTKSNSVNSEYSECCACRCVSCCDLLYRGSSWLTARPAVPGGVSTRVPTELELSKLLTRQTLRHFHKQFVRSAAEPLHLQGLLREALWEGPGSGSTNVAWKQSQAAGKAPREVGVGGVIRLYASEGPFASYGLVGG